MQEIETEQNEPDDQIQIDLDGLCLGDDKDDILNNLDKIVESMIIDNNIPSQLAPQIKSHLIAKLAQ